MILRFITEDWRMKLLGLGLAVLMLGAVAFAQNQPTTGSLDVGLDYVVTSQDIVLVNPPSKINVTYTGLADAVQKVSSSTLLATVDTTGAKPGTGVSLKVTAKSLIPQVSVQQPPPIAVNIDTRQKITIPVQVKATAQSGWEIDPTKTLATCAGAKYANPCAVQFDGPFSWEAGLKAVATLQGVFGKNDFVNVPVQLQPTSTVDLGVRTVPSIGVDVTSCDVHIEAAQGATSITVPLIDAPPSKPPPPGYRVTAITITPLSVTITGDSAVLARIQNISLPAFDLSHSQSDAIFTLPIQYPRGVSGDVQTATIKFSISANPNVSPSPGG
ncbi:MAG TPA: CdaR family protein [Candidatus Dormibacteraeota bacterium]|nr:CdaR family protein [Candidatus Dormibacteraeota bacterium]